MRKFESREFLNALTKRKNGQVVRSCPHCGGSKFTTTSQVAKIIVGENIDGINLGPIIPAGMLICENCGHIDFFAIGALGMLNTKEGESDGEQKKD